MCPSTEGQSSVRYIFTCTRNMPNRGWAMKRGGSKTVKSGCLLGEVGVLYRALVLTCLITGTRGAQTMDLETACILRENRDMLKLV